MNITFKILSKILVISCISIYSYNVFAINFGGMGSRIGKEIQNLNPFALNTPEKRAEDFYKNAENEEFECVRGSSRVSLLDGYLTARNAVVGQVRKLSKDKTLLVSFINNRRDLTCLIDDRDWINDDIHELSACLIGDKPILLCKRTQK